MVNAAAAATLLTNSRLGIVVMRPSPVPAPLRGPSRAAGTARRKRPGPPRQNRPAAPRSRSEEHTSELQSRLHLVCRLLLEKKKNKNKKYTDTCAVLIVASIDNRPD